MALAASAKTSSAVFFEDEGTASESSSFFFD
jgi:hypothetical protein